MSNLENKLLKGAEELAKEKKVPTEVVVTQLKAAIAAAYEKEFPGTIVEIDIDLDENKMNVFEVYEVIAEETDEFDDYNQILLVDAEEGVKDKKLLGEAVVGKQVRKPVELSKLNNKVISLISANFVKNLSFESNKTIFAEWKNEIGKVAYYKVESVSPDGIVVDMEENIKGFIPREEQIPGEKLVPGVKYQFLIKSVIENSKTWPIILSRGDAGLVKYLVVNAISEVREEVIEIKDIARVPGFKTKIALVSHRPNLDPVGTLIGRRGERVKAIMEKINNEKIEGVRYTDDLNQYICNICLPVRLKGILVEKPRDQSESTNYVLIVSDEPVVNSFTQKSSTPSFMLLGKRGANTKIISQLLKGSVEVITEEEALDLDLNKKPEYVVVGDNYYNRSFDNNTSGSPYGNNDKTSRYKINYDEMDSLVKEQNKNRAYSQSKPVQNQEPASSSYEVKKHTKITFDDEDEE